VWRCTALRRLGSVTHYTVCVCVSVRVTNIVPQSDILGGYVSHPDGSAAPLEVNTHTHTHTLPRERNYNYQLTHRNYSWRREREREREREMNAVRTIDARKNETARDKSREEMDGDWEKSYHFFL